MALQDAIFRLEQMGLTDVLLPFALIFTILYAVSAAVPHISGSENKKLRVVVSLVVSLMVVVPHVTRSYPAGLDVVNIINASIPQIVLLIIAAVLTLFLVSATTGKNNSSFDGWVGYIRWIALGLVGLIFLDNINFGYGYGYFGNVPLLSWFSDPDLQALLIIVVVFGLVVYFVTSDGSSKGGITYGGKSYSSISALRRELIDVGLDPKAIEDIVKGLK